MIGTHIRDLLGPTLFALNQPYMREALAGKHQVFERIVPGPDGVERHSLAEYFPDIVDGEVLGFMVYVSDLTQLKQTQAALRREQALRSQIESHAAKLDSVLAERTEMLNVLAHEVRQPLNDASAALQSAQRVLRDVGDGQAGEQIGRARAVMGQVLDALDNNLAVASLLARPEPIHQDDTDVDTLIAVAIADMPERERGRVQVRRETSTRTALMDMSLMRLALRNALSNALKFSPPESAVVLRVADSDEPLALLLEVIDAGPGVDPAVLPRLFSRGARGSDASAGHGIGLYIVRQVMLLHGGSVEVVHTGPDGTTLRLVVVQG